MTAIKNSTKKAMIGLCISYSNDFDSWIEGEIVGSAGDFAMVKNFYYNGNFGTKPELLPQIFFIAWSKVFDYSDCSVYMNYADMHGWKHTTP